MRTLFKSILHPTVFFFLFIIFLFYVYLRKRILIPKGYRLPPGPPPRFLLRNLKDLPTKQEWKTYDKWAKAYGDLVYLDLYGTSLLYINSFKLATELMDQRGAIYSNRFKSTMFSDLAKFDWSMLIMQPDSNDWKERRHYFHKTIGRAAIGQYRDVWEKNTRKLLRRLHQSPHLFLKHIRYIVGANIMELVYGIEIHAKDDPFLEVSEQVMEHMNQLMKPGSFLVEVLPFLKYIPSWFPGAGFKRIANKFRHGSIIMRNKPFELVKSSLESGKAAPSVVAELLQGFDDFDRRGPSVSESNEKFEVTVKSLAGDMYMAAIDTTEAVIQVFFMAMVLYPEAQRKAQRELDQAVGSNALPSLRDRPNLPYMDALYKEVLRWHPVAPTGVPHVLARDDLYGNYFIPKGTMVMPNIWSISHSEEVFGENTDEFRPERFLGEEATLDPGMVFGFGRRVCPGRYTAEEIAFITMASILHTFNILPYQTKSGQLEFPNVDAFEPGALSRPKPFKCRIIPRSADLGNVLD